MIQQFVASLKAPKRNVAVCHVCAWCSCGDFFWNLATWIGRILGERLVVTLARLLGGGASTRGGGRVRRKGTGTHQGCDGLVDGILLMFVLFWRRFAPARCASFTSL